MTAPAPDYQVTFKRSKADQALLKAVKQVLADDPSLSFSDLCKQGLQRWLVASETSAAVLVLMELQQQVTRLQQQMASVEQQVLQDDTGAIARLDSRLDELAARLEQMEPGVTHGEVPISDEAIAIPDDETPEAEPDPDPLLSRLGGLLEEF